LERPATAVVVLADAVAVLVFVVVPAVETASNADVTDANRNNNTPRRQQQRRRRIMDLGRCDEEQQSKSPLANE
jgi:hypothetical protein